MKMRSQSRVVVVVMTLGLAVVEWMLFELRRAPYRPPDDMGTLLGVERDWVFFLMGAFAIGWVYGFQMNWLTGARKC